MYMCVGCTHLTVSRGGGEVMYMCVGIEGRRVVCHVYVCRVYSFNCIEGRRVVGHVYVCRVYSFNCIEGRRVVGHVYMCVGCTHLTVSRGGG